MAQVISRRGLSKVCVLALVAASCGGVATPAPASDASVTGDVSTSPVEAVCARSRALNCVAFDCAMVRALNDSFPPRCRAEADALLRCVAQATGTTCAQFQSGMFPACVAQRGAIETCSKGDAGEVPADASASPRAPTPAEWLGPQSAVTLVLEGAGTLSPQDGPGTASLGVAPIGGPANSYVLSFQSDGPGPLGAPIRCRVGLSYNSATRVYAFNPDPTLTERCTAMVLDETTTLTFTGATVSAPTAGGVVVRVDLNASGMLATGVGVLQVTFPPR